MKSLKPSAREKKRYLLVELSQDVRFDSSKSQIKGEDLKKNIEKSILEFIGILGLSKTGLEFIKSDKNSAIISVNRESVDAIRASFCVFPNKIEVKMVSGTLKGLREKI